MRDRSEGPVIDISDDFLKLIHNPDATKAQLKAMQRRIDASSSAHTMVGFYEVCPLKALQVGERRRVRFGIG
jgi:hypothetical protein